MTLNGFAVTHTLAQHQNSAPCKTSTAAHRQPNAHQALGLAVVSEQAPERRQLEAAIADKFHTAYGAQLSNFLPQLMRLSVAGELGAIVGIRPASSGELFLEQYLDIPVQQAVAAQFRTPVDRDQIVEIGNLAATIPGLAYSLFAILATVLDRAGYRWVACTATPQVAAMLARMQFSSKTISGADPARLAAGCADWGKYYASRPQVIVGDTREAARTVAGNRDMAVLLHQLEGPISHMAKSLKRAA
jgi:hypothetical protein